MDQRVRQLEQEWLRTGASQDEVRYLSEALRSRALSWPAVARLAVLDQDAARRALRGRGVSGSDLALLETLGIASAPPPNDILELAKNVEAFGLDVAIRIGLAVARQAARVELATDTDAHALLAEVTTWTQSHKKECSEAALRLAALLISHPSVQAASGDTDGFEPSVWARLAVSNLAYYLAKGTGVLRLGTLEGQNQLGGVLAMGLSAALRKWTTATSLALPPILEEIGPWALDRSVQASR